MAQAADRHARHALTAASTAPQNATLVLVALLAAGFAAAMAGAIGASPEASAATSSVESELTKSFAEAIGERYPQYATAIIAAAKQSFLDGDQWAYSAGIVAALLGAALVFFCFPKKDEEEQLLAQYAAEDAAPLRCIR